MHPYGGKYLGPPTRLLHVRGNMMGFARRGVYFDSPSLPFQPLKTLATKIRTSTIDKQFLTKLPRKLWATEFPKAVERSMPGIDN